MIDAHSIAHAKTPKAVRAVDGADILDGIAKLENLTLPLVAAGMGVSVSYLVKAHRLTPEQRQAVRDGQRPLVLSRTPTEPPKLPTVVPFVTADVEFRLACLVQDVGLDTVLDLLARTEHRVAA